MAINYSYPSGTVTSEDLVLIMDMDSKGKPTRTVTAQSIANLYNAGGVAGVASFTTSLNGLTPNVATTGAVTLAGTLGVASGGTGSTTFAQGGILYGDTANPVAATAVGTAGQVLTSNGAGSAPTFQAAAGSGITNLNSQTGATQEFQNLVNGVGISSAGNIHSFVLSGQYPVASGGTGLGAYTAGDLLYASGATTLAKLAAPGGTGQYLQGGTTPSWTALKNQGAITQYSIAVGDAAGEITSNNLIQVGILPSQVNIGNPSSVSTVLIGNTTAGSSTTISGISKFNVTYNGTTDNNLGFGVNSLNATISGDENTAIGVGSMVNLTSGSDNTTLGKDAASALLSGNNNVLVGKNVGSTLATGSGNILIGKEANVSSASVSGSIAIGGATSAGANAIAFGKGATAGDNAIAIGGGSNAAASTISIAAASTPLTLSSGNNTGTDQLPIMINGVQYYINIFT